MTLDEAAIFLGWHPDTLRRKMRNDLTLPRSKKGKEYRFIQADLENWLRADYPEPARKLLKGFIYITTFLILNGIIHSYLGT